MYYKGLTFRVKHCSCNSFLPTSSTSFLKKSIEVRLFWSFVSIKLDELRMFEVRRLMQNFFLLVLGVLSNATLGDIHKNS